MHSDLLIERLASDLRPVRCGAVPRHLVPALAGGALLAALLAGAALGFRKDMDAALASPMLWIKLGYALALAAIALAAAMRLARPEARTPGLWLAAAAMLPVLVLAGLAMGEMMRTPAADWQALWLGGSWRECPLRIVAVSVPVFLLLAVALRRLAPTRLALAGAAAGLASGAVATAIYAFHCGEASAVFVLCWYTLGIALAAGLGALAGPRLLRW